MKSNRGFTLVEALVALLLLALVIVGLLNLLDSSTTISKVESALADTQENVRFATYHLMRTVRMVGGADLPFARATPAAWLCGQVLNNQPAGTPITTDAGTIDDIAGGTDVLVVRGFFETPPFFVDRFDINPAAGTVTIRERRQPDAGAPIINPLDTVPATDPYEGKGIIFQGFMSTAQYVVGQVAAGGDITGSDPARQLNLIFVDGAGGPWVSLNPDGTAITAGTDPGFDVYRVGVLDSYTYYVRDDFTLMRWRVGSPNAEPVAVNIGSLQVSLGLDTDADGAFDGWNSTPTEAEVAAGNVMGMRITVLGRTPFPVKGWDEPAETFEVEDLNINNVDRGAKWRRMQVTASLRNFIL